MRDIKDYLHFYLGCGVISLDGGSATYILVGVTNDGGMMFKTKDKSYSIDLGHAWKIVLRPLSDMTEEEFKAAGLVTHPKYWKEPVANYSFQIRATIYMLSRGFDLFGLIEENLAIDKTTIK